MYYDIQNWTQIPLAVSAVTVLLMLYFEFGHFPQWPTFWWSICGLLNYVNTKMIKTFADNMSFHFSLIKKFD